MKTVMKIFVVLVLSFMAVPGTCPAQNVWKFNADSCRARALENNAAVRNADLKVQAAVETKRSAVAKYFPSVSANVSAFLLHDYLVDVSTSDVTDGKISVFDYLKHHLGYQISVSNYSEQNGKAKFLITNYGFAAPHGYALNVYVDGEKVYSAALDDLNIFSERYVEYTFGGGETEVEM